LQWATYYDAADQVGVSRIWGGIHPPVDDFTGRQVGAQCGQAVWALAQKYFDGSVVRTPVTLALSQQGAGTNELRFNTLRSLYYKVQSSTSLGLPFSDEPGGATRALEGWIIRTNPAAGPQKFYRVSASLTP